MGSSHGSTKLPNLEGNITDWRIKQKLSYVNVWCRRDNPSFELQEYPFYARGEKELMKQKGLYFLRKDHPTLVATQYFTEEKRQNFCSNSYKGSLFIQRIPLRLSNITDIPFPDILHAYIQSFKSFELLSHEFGYFQVEENNICVNCVGIIKIWMNQELERSYTAQKATTEQRMVRQIIELLEANTDLDTMPRKEPSLLNFIYKNKVQEDIGFSEAEQALKNYAEKYNKGELPQKLTCLERVGGAQAVCREIQTPQIMSNTFIYRDTVKQPQSNSNHLGPSVNIANPQQVNQNYQRNILNNRTLGESNMINNKPDRNSIVMRYQSVSPQSRIHNQTNVLSGVTNGRNLANNQEKSQNRYIQSRKTIVSSKSDNHIANKAMFTYNQINHHVNDQDGYSPLNRRKGDQYNRVAAPQEVVYQKVLEPHQVTVMQDIKSRRLIPSANLTIKNLSAVSQQKKKILQYPSPQVKITHYSGMSGSTLQRGIKASHTNYNINTKSSEHHNKQNSSDVFHAKAVQASNIIDREHPVEQEQQKSPFSQASAIGRGKPIHRSNLFNENDNIYSNQAHIHNLALVPQTNQQGLNNHDTIMEYNSHAQLQEYTQSQSKFIEKKQLLSKVDKKVTNSQTAKVESSVSRSSVELLQQLKNVKKKADEEIRKSRHEAQRDAFNQIRNQYDMMAEKNQLGNFGHWQPSQFSRTQNPMQWDRSQYQSEFTDSAKKAENSKTEAIKLQQQSNHQRQEYHISYDPDVLQDMNRPFK